MSNENPMSPGGGGKTRPAKFGRGTVIATAVVAGVGCVAALGLLMPSANGDTPSSTPSAPVSTSVPTTSTPSVPVSTPVSSPSATPTTPVVSPSSSASPSSTPSSSATVTPVTPPAPHIAQRAKCSDVTHQGLVSIPVVQGDTYQYEFGGKFYDVPSNLVSQRPDMGVVYYRAVVTGTDTVVGGPWGIQMVYTDGTTTCASSSSSHHKHHKSNSSSHHKHHTTHKSSSSSGNGSSSSSNTGSAGSSFTAGVGNTGDSQTLGISEDYVIGIAAVLGLFAAGGYAAFRRHGAHQE